MTYLGQNNQQNSTTVFNAMDTDRPSMQHESYINTEEDIKIDGDVLSVSHSNVCAHACVWARGGARGGRGGGHLPLLTPKTSLHM